MVGGGLETSESSTMYRRWFLLVTAVLTTHAGAQSRISVTPLTLDGPATSTGQISLAIEAGAYEQLEDAYAADQPVRREAGHSPGRHVQRAHPWTKFVRVPRDDA